MVGLAHTRLELLSVEVQEEVARFTRLLLWALVAIISGALGVVFVAMSILIALWDTHRLAAAVALAGLFLALGALAAWSARRMFRARPRLFDASLRELARDVSDLNPRG
jgi:uncharacterized membrane protein YqjE